MTKATPSLENTTFSAFLHFYCFTATAPLARRLFFDFSARDDFVEADTMRLAELLKTAFQYERKIRMEKKNMGNQKTRPK